jgi:hypothetical protein
VPGCCVLRLQEAMTVLSSRQPVPPAGPSEVARFVASTGVTVHIIDDRSVDPSEIRIVAESADGVSQNELFSSTSSRMTVLDLIKVIQGLGYAADYEKII